MELYYYGLSDPGMARPNNEDYLFAGKLRENEYLFIVADGMGGHQAGEVASRKAVTMFVQLLEKQKGFPRAREVNNGIILEGLKHIVNEINETLIQEGSRSAKKNGMGTTLSALYIKDDLCYIVHVGDSRIYMYENVPVPAAPGGANPAVASGIRLVQLTEDHSFVGKLVKDGFISEEDARNHPKRNVLYQTIGLKPDIAIQTVDAVPLRHGQKFMLCSDGLYGVVSDQELKATLGGNSTAQIAGQLVKLANANGGPDNISVIIVSTEEDDSTKIEDTVKIVAPPPGKTKKQTIWVFILLGLLVLLLALIIYFLLGNTESTPPAPASPEAKTMALLPVSTELSVKGS